MIMIKTGLTTMTFKEINRHDGKPIGPVSCIEIKVRPSIPSCGNEFHQLIFSCVENIFPPFQDALSGVLFFLQKSN